MSYIGYFYKLPISAQIVIERLANSPS